MPELRDLLVDLSDEEVPDLVLEMSVPAGPCAAVFDADGVLWRGDVSEDFTRWMIGQGVFDGALWGEYESVNAADPAAGCFDILRFYGGHSCEEVDSMVARFWSEGPSRSWQRSILATLAWAARNRFEIFVVSGTPWPVLRFLQEQRVLPIDRVLALELEIDADGCYTGWPAGTPSVGEGKATRIRGATDSPVHLALGNSSLDLAMLRTSRGIAWAVDPDDSLRAASEKDGWLITEETR